MSARQRGRVKTGPAQPGISSEPGPQGNGAQLQTHIGGGGKELGRTPRKPTSADIGGLCCPQDFLWFCYEHYPLSRSLHHTDTEPGGTVIPNSRNLITLPFAGWE